MKTIVVFNQKGGVGKTSTVANLMAEMKRRNLRVLGVDLDAQANLTAFNGIVNPTKTVRDVLLNEIPLEQAVQPCKYGDILPADSALQAEQMRFATMPAFVIRLRTLLQPLADTYDVILIDCPPVVNQVTAAALVAADYVIIPAEAEYFSAVGVEMLANTINEVKPLNPNIKVLGVLLVKYQKRRTLTRALEEVLCSSTQKALDCGVFNARIHFTVDIPASQASGLSVRDYRNGSKATEDYMTLCEEILKEI